MRPFILSCLILLVSVATYGSAFVQPNTSGSVHHRSVASTKATVSSTSLCVRLNDEDDNEVNVNLLPDVDAFTLTAVGFGLIAFNFFVLANVRTMYPCLYNQTFSPSHFRFSQHFWCHHSEINSFANFTKTGDMGVGGIVARIINTFG